MRGRFIPTKGIEVGRDLEFSMTREENIDMRVELIVSQVHKLH